MKNRRFASAANGPAGAVGSFELRRARGAGPLLQNASVYRGRVELALPERRAVHRGAHPGGAWRGEPAGVYETELRGWEDGRLWGACSPWSAVWAADYEVLLAYGAEPEAFARMDGRYYNTGIRTAYRGRTGPRPGGPPRSRRRSPARADFITRPAITQRPGAL